MTGKRGKKKPEPKMLMARVVCQCGWGQDIATEHLGFTGGSTPCDTCGSHGSVKLNFTCARCKKRNDIVLESW